MLPTLRLTTKFLSAKLATLATSFEITSKIVIVLRAFAFSRTVTNTLKSASSEIVGTLAAKKWVRFFIAHHCM